MWDLLTFLDILGFKLDQFLNILSSETSTIDINSFEIFVHDIFMCLTTYRCLHDLAPDYLKSVAYHTWACESSVRQSRPLASSWTKSFENKKWTKLRALEIGASALVAHVNGTYFPLKLCDARLSLPAFKSLLKTHLFKYLWWWCGVHMSLWVCFRFLGSIWLALLLL